MRPSRNDPCPCGSGRKYKRCCADADARRDRTLTLLGGDREQRTRGRPAGPSVREMLRAAPQGVPWEVDAIPLAGLAFDDAPDARPVGLIVASAGFVLNADIVAHPPSEPDDVGKFLANAVEATAREAGRWPSTVFVRHNSVVPAATAALAAHDVVIRSTESLPTIDEAGAGAGLQRAVTRDQPDADTGQESSQPLLVSSPESWHAWGLPDSLLESLFRAAALYYDAQPWKDLFNSETLNITTAGGARWTACALGNAGEQFGLALYADRADYDRLFEADRPLDAGPSFRKVVFHLDFTARRELPKPMQREFSSRNWPVAGPTAYPRLFAFNTPAGGISRQQADELAGSLSASARFCQVHEEEVAAHRLPIGEEWIDDATGFSISYAGEAGEMFDSLWLPPERLALGFAQGTGADPQATIDYEDASAREEVLAAFTAWLETPEKGRRGLTTASARKHAMNAQLFLDFLQNYEGVSVAAVHERHLRSFLYDWFPRKVHMRQAAAISVLGSLERFFLYLKSSRRIRCDWAAPLLADREIFQQRWDEFPGGSGGIRQCKSGCTT
jgi:hypothetical protein